MPQIQINSVNIDTFAYKATFNIFNRTIVFDTSANVYNTASNQGIFYVQGISFSVIDQDNVVLATIDFTNPSNYIVPHVTQIFTLDLSSLNYAFLFQTYQISAAIKDQDGTVYTIPVIFSAICQPNGLNESGYVDGMFSVTADCVNNLLTVKELTLLTYNNLAPISVSKTGTLYYPQGTISPVNFTNTPFTNNQVYTGSNVLKCQTDAIYSIGNDIYVDVTYLTNQNFPVTCSDSIGNLICCIESVQQTAIANCNNATGARARQKLQDVAIPFFLGIAKESNGQDASAEALLIQKALNCNCGNGSLGQNEITPINPAVNTIVLNGVGGTSIPTVAVSGNTKTYSIASNVYQVVKGDTGDMAFSIAIDTSVQYTVKYKITFNYAVMAASIYTATASSPTLIAQLNSLISATANINLTNLNGECVINLSSVNYFLSFLTPNASTVFKNIIIGSTTYAAASGLLVSDEAGMETFLNGLGLGTFTVSYSSGYLNILTVGNTNNPSSVTLTINGSDKSILFQKTNKSLIAVLQAIIDYLCNLTALQVALGSNLTLCQFDYSGNVINVNSLSTDSQSTFNNRVSTAICNIVSRMSSVIGTTCDTIKNIFQDYPNASFNYASDRYLSIVGGNCTTLNSKQAALAFIDAVNADSQTKAAFCAINCNTAGTCPEVSGNNVSMSGGNIGIYGLTWANTPSASQTVTVRYRIHGNLTWLISTNALVILPNGNVSSNPPYLITGVTSGTTYDIWIQNNCGGNGFVSQITTPTGTVYNNQYLLDTNIYNICGESPVTLYSSSPFATGITLYTNPGLTVPITGYTLVALASGGEIFQLNTSTGVVGIDTGTACNTGTAGTYILGNDTYNICGNTPSTLYTNGAFAIGVTLYVDSALSTPQTGFSYVVKGGTIYTLNPSTGQITGTTGLNCAPLSIVLGRSGSNLIATADGGSGHYQYHFFGAYTSTGGCTPSYSIANPNQTSTGTVTTAFTYTPFSSVNYYFYCIATDTITGDTVTSNVITTGTCLVSETRIKLREGNEIALSEIKISDELFDIEELFTDNKVISFEKFKVNKLYSINKGLLITSEGHINVVKNGEQHILVPSLSLKKGDVLVDLNLNDVEVTNIEILNEEREVINIYTTSGFFVANGILTHNKTIC